MNWIQENKGLAAFLGICAAGAGVLGYLTFAANGKLAEARELFAQKSGELAGLQNSKPFPEEGNLAKVVAQKKEFEGKIEKLKANLSTMEFPLEGDVSPSSFQDRLTNVIRAVEKRALEAGVKLPEKFALGFGEYVNVPPSPEAAPGLARQLKGIEFVVNALLDNKVTEIKGLSRLPLPSEGIARPQQEREGEQRGSQPDAGPPLLRAETFELGFVADQGRLRNVLNTLASARQPFIVVRALKVENEKIEGPLRGANGFGGADFAAPVQEPAAVESLFGQAPAATSNPSGQSLQYVVGTEQVRVGLRLDLLDFDTGSAAKN